MRLELLDVDSLLLGALWIILNLWGRMLLTSSACSEIRALFVGSSLDICAHYIVDQWALGACSTTRNFIGSTVNTRSAVRCIISISVSLLWLTGDKRAWFLSNFTFRAIHLLVVVVSLMIGWRVMRWCWLGAEARIRCWVVAPSSNHWMVRVFCYLVMLPSMSSSTDPVIAINHIRASSC